MDIIVDDLVRDKISEAMSTIAVSYTHLDVYKRQDLYPFPDNPFHVAEDETLSELAEIGRAHV